MIDPITPRPDYGAAPEALARLEPTLLALPAADIRPFRASATAAVIRAFAVARAYARDRALFVATFTTAGFDVAAHDDIEQRALALWQADVELRLVIDPDDSLPRLLVPARPLRRKLLRAAVYLWQHDPELGSQVRDIRRGRGYLDLADDLTALASLFERHWDSARGRVDVGPGDLAEARRLGVEVAHAITRGDRRVAAGRNLRNRAGHHLQRGVRRIQGAARFVFLDDPARLSDYPALFAESRRRRAAAPDPAAGGTGQVDGGGGGGAPGEP